jgi:hypothetical protein
MDYERMANALNEARVAQGLERLSNDEIIKELIASHNQIANGDLNEDEKRALEQFRNKELEREIKDTPFIIKAIWFFIFSGLLYWLFN